MQSDQTTPPKRIWANPEAMDGFYEGFSVYSTPAGFSVQQGLWPEYILASEVAALIAEAEDRGMERAAKLVPLGYAFWAQKSHNAKWVRKIDGTPIPNDLPVCIQEIIRAEAAALRAAKGETT